jgi:general secretion pathway protein A
MYLSYYGLKEKPFQITADPNFLWLGEKHKEALSTLQYGILENKGFVLLTGEVGTGKTVLINQLVTVLDVDTIIATIPDPDLDSLDFYKLLAAGFGIKKTFMSKGGFLMHLRDFLHQSYADKKQVLLIVDEAQRLGDKLLEEIRLLSNIELHDRKLINIFFVGQTEFKATLMEHRNRAVAQRITVKYDIKPLEPSEIEAFISHRLKVAGTDQAIFSKDAISEIYAFSEGIPRLINIICDHALLTGFAYGRKKIDKAIVAECADELYMPVKKELKREAMADTVDEIKEQVIKEVLQKTGGIETAQIAEGNPSEKSIQAAGGIVQVVEAKPGNNSAGDQKRTAAKTGNSKSNAGNKGAGIKNKGPATASAATRKPAGKNPAGKLSSLIPKVIVALFIVVLVGGISYFFIHANAPDEPKFAMEDLTPQDFESSLEKERKVLQERVDKGDFNEEAAAETETADTPATAETTAAETTTEAVPDSQERANIEEDLSLLMQEKFLIHFELNSNDIDADAFEDLDRIAAFMQRHADRQIVVSGYSDAVGAPSYNVSVSRFRANAVKSYLIGKGASSENIVVEALGSADPIADNATAAGRKLNRRVEIRFVDALANG